jgi:NAD(P)-dependent dehydrogenase (short-subunit alcohol dehydrogenase family)
MTAMPNERLAGKIAIVTGSSTGIGAATVRHFWETGAQVLALDVADPGDELTATARDAGDRVRLERVDVSDEDAWRRAMDLCKETFGSPNVLVNNAGVHGTKKAVHEETLEGFHATLAVNLVSVFLGMRAVIPEMLGAGGGSIVNVSSVWGLYAAAGNAAYHASKGAVTVLSKNAAVTYAERGIRVNCLLPGYVDTPMSRKVTEDEARALIAMTPVRRVGMPHEVAPILVYLASDESSFTTGGLFFVDGGMAAL